MIRQYEESDLQALKKIHAKQGFDYQFPDLSDEMFLSKVVVDCGDGVEMAALLRITSEAYLLVDPDKGTPRDKWNNLLQLHEATRRDAVARGLYDVHAFLPPSLAGSFDRRLKRLGWKKEHWRCYWRKTEGE